MPTEPREEPVIASGSDKAALRLPLAYGFGALITSLSSIAAQAAGGNWAVSIAVGVGIAAAVAYGAHRYVNPRFLAMRRIQASLLALIENRPIELLEPASMGDLADTARTVNRVVAAIGEVRERLAGMSREIGRLPDQVDAALAAVSRAASAQEAAVEETAALQANITTSTRKSNLEVERLSHLNDESASSILELGSAVEQVARSAAALQETIEASASSLLQMGENIRMVASSAETVQESAEETAASITEMDRAIQEVGQHARGAADLTQRVNDSAHQGSEAVDATIRGIDEIRRISEEARGALQDLAGRIAEIGEITTVISSVTDETNLLSLNAAIIAAQAGEHGRAFAVVADQVKTLARRTSQSTQEIETLIRSIQQQSKLAVEAMAAGIDAVERGVGRSRAAGDALSTIRGAAQEANGRVLEIARAAEEQARNSRQVAEAARRSAEHVTQIASAMAEQSNASELLLRNSQESVDMCRQMATATQEQRSSSQYITKNIESITDLIHRVQELSRSQEEASSAVSSTFEDLLENARGGLEKLPELSSLVQEIHRHAEMLRRELARFDA